MIEIDSVTFALKAQVNIHFLKIMSMKQYHYFDCLFTIKISSSLKALLNSP